MTKTAFLHFDFISKNSKQNMEQIIQGIKVSAKNGAKIILTPEMALQGYHFARQNRLNETVANLEETLKPIINLAKELSVYVFLGLAINENELLKNSYILINDKGIITGKQDKKNIHGISESWSFKGNTDCIYSVDNIKTGVLICVDSFYNENIINLKNLGAQIIIIPSAWISDDRANPEKYWCKCSKVCNNCIVLVCNQTGKSNWLDCNSANSAIINNSEIYLKYSGKPAILLADIDLKQNKILNEKFYIIPFQ